MIRAIVFDFDGVILDSNEIRSRTYFDIFSGIQNSGDFVRQSLEENSKRTRYGVVRAILEKLKDRGLVEFSDLDGETEKYVEEYNRVTEELVSQANEIKGATTAVKTLSRRYPLYIITGTIQSSIDIVLKNIALGSCFRKVYGGYPDKVEGFTKFIEDTELDPKSVVFIGDGKLDHACARHFGSNFVGIVNETNDFGTREDIKYRLTDLTEIISVIEEIDRSCGFDSGGLKH